MEYKLRQHLFNQYTPSSRPVSDPAHVLNVTFNMRLIRLVGVEEKAQKVVTQVRIGTSAKKTGGGRLLFGKFRPPDIIYTSPFIITFTFQVCILQEVVYFTDKNGCQ